MKKLTFLFLALIVGSLVFAAPTFSGSSVFTLNRAADGALSYSDSTTLSVAYSAAASGLPVSVGVAGSIDIIDSVTTTNAAKITVAYAPIWLSATLDTAWALKFAPSFDVGGLVTLRGKGTFSNAVLGTANPTLAVNAGVTKGAKILPALAATVDADVVDILVDVNPLVALAVSYKVGDAMWVKPYGAFSIQLPDSTLGYSAGVKAGFFAGGTFDLNYNPVTELAYASFTFDF